MSSMESAAPRVRCAETGEVYTIHITGAGTFKCPGCERTHKA